ncbi:MAG TPA: DUF6790 family protein [Coxiellaceae bacterium]|nr:DUF6790 family protein [Coxiellaceae bacterium]
MLAISIEHFFENFGMAMFILALLIVLFTYKTSTTPPLENLFRWLCLLPLGVNGIYSFIMHGFFGDMTASLIGWHNSPFQWEVAVANLGFGLIGLMAFKASMGFRKAVVIVSSCWLWGAGLGHIYQMIEQHDFALGNAGSWFWLDMFLPLVLIVCFARMSQQNKF